MASKPPYSHHWHLSICPPVAWRLVSQCRINMCQVFVAMRLQLASRPCLLQIACQPDASKQMEILGPILPAGHVTSHGATAGTLWTTCHTVPIQHPMISISLAPLKKHLDGKQFATDASMTMSPPGYKHWTQISSMPGYKPWNHSGINACMSTVAM